MKIKRFIRLLALILLIALASVLPVPLIFYKKDKMPKYLLEQIDKKEDENEDDIKAIF
jgi:hypothetical protein